MIREGNGAERFERTAQGHQVEFCPPCWTGSRSSSESSTMMTGWPVLGGFGSPVPERKVRGVKPSEHPPPSGHPFCHARECEAPIILTRHCALRWDRAWCSGLWACLLRGIGWARFRRLNPGCPTPQPSAFHSPRPGIELRARAQSVVAGSDGRERGSADRPERRTA